MVNNSVIAHSWDCVQCSISKMVDVFVTENTKGVGHGYHWWKNYLQQEQTIIVRYVTYVEDYR